MGTRTQHHVPKPSARGVLSRSCSMRTLVFVCPITGHPVQSSLPEEAFKDPDTYHRIECTACGRVHLVNPTTGRVLRRGEE